MNLEDLQNKKVGIIGTAQEGQAIARYLTSHGIKPELFDQNPQLPAIAHDISEQYQLTLHLGENYLDKLGDMDVIFRSPGFRRLHPALVAAESKGALITSQTKWFFSQCPAKIVGVTGTKGKGTTCSLIYEMLTGDATRKSYLTGNIGKQQPLEFLDSLTPEDVVVYEMSSFQLQDLEQSPHIGVCLMVTSDHLDHHADLQEYWAAKSAITAYQTASDVAIYNADYPASVEIGQKGQGRKLCFSEKTIIGDGAEIAEDKLTIHRPGQEINLDCHERQLRGHHNMQNIAAASLAGLELGIAPEKILEAIKNFKGLEHRLQYLGESKGIKFYNDSISTVPETTIAAVSSFIEPVILFLGGSDKGLPFDQLADFLASAPQIKTIALLGQTGAMIKPLLDKAGFKKQIIGPSTNFENIFNEAVDGAEPGDVVLLSPASASFDMFENYAARGRQFAALVQERVANG